MQRNHSIENMAYNKNFVLTMERTYLQSRMENPDKKLRRFSSTLSKWAICNCM
jgi:hypothetical protein